MKDREPRRMEIRPEHEGIEILPSDIGSLSSAEVAPLLERAASRIEIVKPETEFWQGLGENLRGAAAYIEAQRGKLASKTFRAVVGASLVATVVSACAKPVEPTIIPEATRSTASKVIPTEAPTAMPEIPTPEILATATETFTPFTPPVNPPEFTPGGAGGEFPEGGFPVWSYDTHPNFWAAGSHKYTAKKYSLLSGAPNPGYEFNWVWSGPYGSNQRYVIYQAYPNDSPGAYLESERWSGDIGSHRATVHTYGGPSEASSKPRYPSYSSCLAKQTGVDWPNLTAGAKFSFSPESDDYQGYCTNHWVNDTSPGGYIAIYLKESYATGTSGRDNMCNKLVPASESLSANSICKISPNAGVIEQRYLIPDSGNYTHGCEMTVYTWGYSYESAENYRNWFRNGELRWSDWLNLGWLSSPKSPDDDGWWGVECSRAWSEKPNWVYTGTYKLTATEYFDGGSGPTPTGGFPGVPAYGGANADFQAGAGTGRAAEDPYNWLAASRYLGRIYDYTYFKK